MTRLALIVVAAAGLVCLRLGNSQRERYPDFNAVSSPAPSGPLELGPIDFSGRIGAVPIRAIRAKIGNPPLPSTDVVCYKEPSSGTYLWLARGADDQNLVRGVGLATFGNCTGAPVYRANDFGHWTTKERVGLGSSAAAVISAYGPSRATYNATSRPEAFFDAFAGPGNPRAKTRAPAKWLVLRYTSSVDELYVAEFGIVSGRVVWIWMSDNE